MGAFDAGSMETHGQDQHLIVWIDLGQPTSEIVVRDGVSRIVGDILPGARLREIVKNPL